MFWIVLFGCHNNPIARCEQAEDVQNCLQRVLLKVGSVEQKLFLCATDLQMTKYVENVSF